MRELKVRGVGLKSYIEYIGAFWGGGLWILEIRKAKREEEILCGLR